MFATRYSALVSVAECLLDCAMFGRESSSCLGEMQIFLLLSCARKRARNESNEKATSIKIIFLAFTELETLPPAFWVISVKRVDVLRLNALKIVRLRLIVGNLLVPENRWICAGLGRQNLVDCRRRLWLSVRKEPPLEKVCQNLFGYAILSLDLMLRVVVPYKESGESEGKKWILV